MDILNFICISILFFPLIFGIYLIYSRVALAAVNKNILKWGNLVTNSLCFFASLVMCYFVSLNSISNVSPDTASLYYPFSVVLDNETKFNFGFLIDKSNISLLLYSTITYILISFFSKLYFEKKKQFLFTKQRYYIFLSLLSFNTYMFIISSNLLQGILFWILQGLIIFIFSYFDLFKNAVNFNITRFARITIIGDFALIVASFILYKYAVISKSYIDTGLLDYSSLDILISYAKGIAKNYEFFLIISCFIVAVMSKFFIFPFSCYYSFFANSSNLLYVSILTVSNTVFGLLLFDKIFQCFDLINYNKVYVVIAFVMFVIIQSLFLLFEKNLKIIFGYIISSINTLFVMIYVVFPKDITLFGFYIINSVILFVVMKLFLKDVLSLKSSVIKKQSGFILEKAHIFIFERLPEKIFNIFNFIDENVFQNINFIFVKVCGLISNLFVIRVDKQSNFTKIRIILIIFAIFAIISILIAFFGRGNAELIK